MVDLRLFWAWAVVRMREEQFPVYFSQLDRLHLISTINLVSLSQHQVETALFVLVESEEFKLRKLTLNWRDSSSSVLSRALVKTEEVVVKSTFPSPEMAVGSLEDLCRTIVRWKDLKTRKLKIHICTTNSQPSFPPPAASPELLAAALVRLVEINLDFVLSSEQLEALATKIAREKDLKLEIVRLNANCELDLVAPEILSRAIIRLKKIPSGSILKLSSQQIYFLFQTLHESEKRKVRLNDLDLRGRLSDAHVPPDCLAGAVVKVETVKLPYSRLTPDQSKALLTRLATSAETIKTKSLNICCNDLSSVPATALIGTIERLDQIDLTRTNLNESQMTAVLKKFVEESTFRRKIVGVYGLSSSEVLGSLSGDLLAKSLARLKSVKLLREFSSDQVSSILTEVAERDFTKNIVFQSDLSLVSSDLLARALVNMESIQFNGKACLSLDQAKIIFNSLTASTGLKNMSFATTEHSDLSSVEPTVLSEVLVRLRSVHISRTLLRSEQLQALFLKIAETKDSKLKELNMSEIDLSSIPGEILGQALVRLKYVQLRKTNLTPEIRRGLKKNKKK